MIHTVVAVRDRAAEAFSRPFYAPAKGAAIRTFQDEINRPAADNPLYQHPSDYDLFLLGTWDDNSGQHILLSQPELLLGGESAKNQD